MQVLFSWRLFFFYLKQNPSWMLTDNVAAVFAGDGWIRCNYRKFTVLLSCNYPHREASVVYWTNTLGAEGRLIWILVSTLHLMFCLLGFFFFLLQLCHIETLTLLLFRYQADLVQFYIISANFTLCRYGASTVSLIFVGRHPSDLNINQIIMRN